MDDTQQDTKNFIDRVIETAGGGPSFNRAMREIQSDPEGIWFMNLILLSMTTKEIAAGQSKAKYLRDYLKPVLNNFDGLIKAIEAALRHGGVISCMQEQQNTVQQLQALREPFQREADRLKNARKRTNDPKNLHAVTTSGTKADIKSLLVYACYTLLKRPANSIKQATKWAELLAAAIWSVYGKNIDDLSIVFFNRARRKLSERNLTPTRRKSETRTKRKSKKF